MNDQRIIAAGATREDEAIEASIRPKRLDEYLALHAHVARANGPTPVLAQPAAAPGTN